MADEQVRFLAGEQWTPSSGFAGRRLRAPKAGSLDDLLARFAQWRDRITAKGLREVPPLQEYIDVSYRRATDPAPKPCAAFALRTLDGGGFQLFDAARRALTVAGMMRHATRAAAERAGWPPDKVNRIVLGHSDSTASGKRVAVGAERFAYLPLPTIEFRGTDRPRSVGSVRRAIVTSFSDNSQSEVQWARQHLAGTQLVDEQSGEPRALLLHADDNVVNRYLDASASWATVTPVVLPGYDDPDHYRRRLREGVSADEQRKLLAALSQRIDSLLRKAIVQAGYSKILANHVELEWRGSGFFPGVELASRYGVPDHLKRFPRLHVRLQWRDPQGSPLTLPGPVCLGGGRFYGVGLFAPV